MDKKELESELLKLNQQVSDLTLTKQSEIKEQLALRVEPLLEQAKIIRAEIDNDFYKKYQTEFSELHKKKVELTNAINEIKIQEAKDIWYPEGTVVYLWEHSKYGFRKELNKTKKTGVVAVYDGTQELNKVKVWQQPKKGDIIVIHKKANGSLGLMYDTISEYGSLKNYIPNWFAENETPENNLTKTIRDKEREKERQEELEEEQKLREQEKLETNEQ